MAIGDSDGGAQPEASHMLHTVGAHWPWRRMNSSPLAVAHELMHGRNCPHSRAVVQGRQAVAVRLCPRATTVATDAGDDPGVHVDFLLADGTIDCPFGQGCCGNEDEFPFSFEPPRDGE